MSTIYYIGRGDLSTEILRFEDQQGRPVVHTASCEKSTSELIRLTKDIFKDKLTKAERRCKAVPV